MGNKFMAILEKDEISDKDILEYFLELAKQGNLDLTWGTEAAYSFLCKKEKVTRGYGSLFDMTLYKHRKWFKESHALVIYFYRPIVTRRFSISEEEYETFLEILEKSREKKKKEERGFINGEIKTALKRAAIFYK